MAPPILTFKGVSGYLRVSEGKVDIPHHHNMATFQLADKFTFTNMFASEISRLAVWFLSIFHGGASISGWRKVKTAGKPEIRDLYIRTAVYYLGRHWHGTSI